MSADQFERALNTPNVRLAHVPGAQGDNCMLGRNGVEPLPDTSLPALLVSFYYLDEFMTNCHRYRYRDWVIDSGAFSAWNSGVEIDLKEYIEVCKVLLEEDPTLTEIFALDVIGDWKGTLRNTEKMWSEGIRAIPCYHYGEPWDALKQLAKDYPKIALGGVAKMSSQGASKKKFEWAGQCFARTWPKPIHGFSYGTEQAILGFPWHSTDCTNWELGPCGFGRWQAFGGASISVRGSSQNLRVEVEWYLDLERRARERWKKEMGILQQMLSEDPRWEDRSISVPPNVRLSEHTGSKGRLEAKEKAFGGTRDEDNSNS